MSTMDGPEAPNTPVAHPPRPATRTYRKWLVAGISGGVVVLALAAFAVNSVLVALINARNAASDGSEGFPDVGVCYYSWHLGNDELRLNAERDDAVPCDEKHNLETIAVGELTSTRLSGANFDREIRDKYAQCAVSAQEYLGMHWRVTHTWLLVSLPGSSAWLEGERWYRCDLTRTDTFAFDGGVTTTGRLSDAVQPLTCVTWAIDSDDVVWKEELSECAVTHQGEVAGAFDAGDIDRLRESDFVDRVEARCESIVEEFLGQPTMSEELTYWYWSPSDEYATDQSVLCVVAAAENGRSFTGSLEGIGDEPIPFV